MRTRLAAIALFSLLEISALAQDVPRYSHTGTTKIVGVRVIDGLGGKPKENQDVVLSDGKIASISPAGRLGGRKVVGPKGR